METKYQIGLTDRELDVLEQLKAGMCSKEISSNLGISVYTVKDYRKNLIKKFGVKNCTELIYIATKLNINCPPLKRD